MINKEPVRMAMDLALGTRTRNRERNAVQRLGNVWRHGECDSIVLSQLREIRKTAGASTGS
jgi:hypothetical protein